MAEKSAGIARYRISVPVNDESVIDWIQNQYNLSHSIRLIIKEHIQRHGMMDATCGAVQKISRGRPPKKSVEMFEQAEQAVEQGYMNEDDVVPEYEPAASAPRTGMGRVQTDMAPDRGQAVHYAEPKPEPVRQPQPTYQQAPVAQTATASRAASLLDM